MVKRVLIVDDEENHRKTLGIGLRLEGWDVEEAADGEQALAVVDRATVDVAVVDLMMPGINGLDLARRLRFRAPDVKVVLTSAYHLSERQLERAGVGAVGFVPKPYDLPDLVRFLAEKVAEPVAQAQ